MNYNSLISELKIISPQSTVQVSGETLEINADNELTIYPLIGKSVEENLISHILLLYAEKLKKLLGRHFTLSILNGPNCIYHHEKNSVLRFQLFIDKKFVHESLIWKDGIYDEAENISIYYITVYKEYIEKLIKENQIQKDINSIIKLLDEYFIEMRSSIQDEEISQPLRHLFDRIRRVNNNKLY